MTVLDYTVVGQSQSHKAGALCKNHKTRNVGHSYSTEPQRTRRRNLFTIYLPEPNTKQAKFKNQSSSSVRLTNSWILYLMVTAPTPDNSAQMAAHKERTVVFRGKCDKWKL